MFRNADYQRVGVPMMPVVAGDAATRRQIFWYALLLAPVAVAPAFTVAGGPAYFVVATLASIKFVADAYQVSRRNEVDAKNEQYAAEKKLFGTSIVYLFAIFGALIIDAVVRALAGPLGWPVWI